MRYHFGDVDDLELTLASPFGWLIAFVFGAVWGSFYNVVVARLPRGESLVKPGSHCFACGAAVRPRDNIPLLSYLLLRGRCRDCGAKFSPRYLLVELATALLSVALWQAFVRSELALPVGLRLARYAYFFVFVSCLEILALIDAATKRLPDVITLPGIPLFFLAGFAVDAGPWQERAIGLCAGYLVLRLIADFYYYVLKREGMGLGDAKLLALMGGVVGWKALPFILFGASFLGTAVAVPLLLWQRGRERAAETSVEASAEGTTAPSPDATAETSGPVAETSLGRIAVPLGPFLAAAAVLWLFVGGDVLTSFGF